MAPSSDADVLDAGEIVWVEFGSPIGHEQAGRRPAIVVSPRNYNERSSLILVCPITRNVSPWPFKVNIQNAGRIRGAVLVDHLRSVDREARFVRRAEHADRVILAEVYGMLLALLGVASST
ncbi:MAG: type II toxin-antitoxin system PemK/MazF family toxin [Xanthobacteraceae bacterium]